jgi:histidinol-phosphate phosphatase family protein
MRQAVVLVGGRGTRLGALAQDAPKPMLPVVGRKPFLDFLLENIARHGVEDILLLAGHLGELVEARYDGATLRGARISVIREDAPAGTAGALLGVRDRLHDVFLMSNGDSVLDVNYLALSHCMTGEIDAALALRRVEDVRRYASIALEGDRIREFREKDTTRNGPGLISGGVYVLRGSIIDRINNIPCSIEQDVFPTLVNEGRVAGLPFDGYFLDIGLPETLGQARRETVDALRRRAVFFDRDGTLNRDDGYTHKPEDLELQPGAAEAVRATNDSGALAIVVTNQSGLARGYFTESQMDQFHGALQARLREAGAHVDAFYHSPFHEDGVVLEFAIANHPDRKPGSGMLRRAIQDWDIEPAGSLMVGDNQADVHAGEAAGIAATRIVEGGLLQAVRTHLERPRPAASLTLAQATQALKDRAAIAQRWLFDRALPLWGGAGFDKTTNTFHERLNLQGTAVVLPRRIRVQARQTFVYSLAGQMGWTGPWRDLVAAGARTLVERGIRPDGGTNHLLDAAGAQVIDARRDLYDAAFVIFALASASRALEQPALAGHAARLADWVHREWSDPAGGFYEGEIASCPPRRATPHMHMLEALLQLHEATGDAAALERAGAIVKLLETKFVSTQWGALLGTFNADWTPAAGDAGRVVEPGLQFEWAWLLERYARLSGQRITPSTNRIYLHGETYGVDPTTSVTFDEVWADGTLRTAASRFWPHTERIKANLVRFETTGSLTAALDAVQAFDVLATYRNTPAVGAWRDKREPDGTFVNEDSPASSLYHVALSFAELIRVANAR